MKFTIIDHEELKLSNGLNITTYNNCLESRFNLFNFFRPVFFVVDFPNKFVTPSNGIWKNSMPDQVSNPDFLDERGRP